MCIPAASGVATVVSGVASQACRQISAAASWGVDKLCEVKEKIAEIWNEFVEKVRSLRETASCIIPGSMNRVTSGTGYTISFPVSESTPPFLKEFLDYRFTSEQYYCADPIHPNQKDKLRQMVARRDSQSGMMNSLLERSEDPKFCYADFIGDDYLALESANFELLEEFNVKLVAFYNSGYLNDIQSGVRKEHNFDYQEAFIAEILSRTLAQISRAHGKTILLPVRGENGLFEIAGFTISGYRLGESLPAYILECKDDEGNDRFNPWFIVRGTGTINATASDGSTVQEGALESFLADTLHSDGIAEGLLYKHLRRKHVYVSEADERVEHPSLMRLFENRQFKLAGHSLGGNLVNQLTAHLYDFVSNAYAFSSPGVSKETFDEWEKHKDKEAAALAPKLINLQTQGDIVPAGGYKLIGSHIAIDLLEKPEDASLVHTHVLTCLNKPCVLRAVDKDLEELQIGRWTMEIVRQSVGAMAKKIMEWGSYNFPKWHLDRDYYREMHQYKLEYAPNDY